MWSPGEAEGLVSDGSTRKPWEASHPAAPMQAGAELSCLKTQQGAIYFGRSWRALFQIWYKKPL